MPNEYYSFLKVVYQKLLRLLDQKLHALLIALSLSILLIAANASSLNNFWYEINPHNQKYTSLSFTSPGSLPFQTNTYGRVNFTFNIFNKEGSLYLYKYNVAIGSNKQKLVVKIGNVRLADNHFVSIPESLTIPNGFNKPTITVSLIGLHQSIDFILKASAT